MSYLGCEVSTGGRLRKAGQVEALAGNLIAVNRRYHVRAGIRIIGM